jgi:predicted dehydrogenase
MSVGFGVVGAGLFGRRHAQAYALHRDAALIAVCDIRRQRAEAVAAEFGGTVYDRMDEMLRHPGIAAVSVATPDHAHRDVAERAADAGKHLLVEKPLATTVEDARAIIDAARRNGVMLMVDFHNRWNPPFCAARDAIRGGQLGRIRYIYMRLSNAITIPTEMLNWAGNSSVVWFLGSHCLDLLRWLLDAEVTRVFAVSGRGVLEQRGVTADDYVVATLEFSNGAHATLEHVWILPPGGPAIKDFKTEIVGEQGTIYIDSSHNESLVVARPGAAIYPDLFAAPVISGRVDGFVQKSIWHFVDCVRDNRTPEVAGEDGLRVTEAGVAILRAAREGGPVVLPAR